MNYKSLIETVKKHEVFLITTHVNADIDALASQLVMGFYLKSLRKKVYAVNAEAVPRMYRFLPGAPSIKTMKKEGGDPKYDVAIVLDCGDLERTGSVQRLIQKTKATVNIDHHVTNRRFAGLNFVDPNASSTSEMIYDFLKVSGYKITRKIALLLYLGIMTDTGSFRYDNTSPHTHRIVSELMRFKFSVNRLYQKIYETVPLNDLQMFTKAISNFAMTHGGRVISVFLRKKFIDKFSGEFDLREKIFTFLRAVKGVEMIAIFTESKKNLTRVNFRSQGKADVAKLAAFFNGGGHKKASGCQMRGSLRHAQRAIFSRLNKILG